MACPRKFFYSRIWRLTTPRKSIDLHAGGAFAKGIEIARKAFHVDHNSAEHSVHIGLEALWRAYGTFDAEDSAKSFEGMSVAFVRYFDKFPLDSDQLQPLVDRTGKPAIEYNFAIPFDEEILHPETKEPILYAGRFDMIAKLDDTHFIVDEKTTSAFGASWSNRWDLEGQFTGYCWAAQSYGIPVASVMIRGICILKNDIKFMQVPLYRPQWRIERWHSNLKATIKRMIEAHTRIEYEMAEGSACANYGGCEFRTLCLARAPSEWVEGNYITNDWSPLK